MNTPENINIISVVISILSLLWGVIAIFIIARKNHNNNVKLEKIKNLEQLISKEKTSLYENIIKSFFDIFRNKITGKPFSDKKSGLIYVSIKEQALIYAPSNIVKQIAKWNEQNEIDPKSGFKEYMKLVHMIREDLGHKEKITDYDIIGMFINSPTEKARMLAYLIMDTSISETPH